MSGPAGYFGLLAKPIRLADPHAAERGVYPIHLMTAEKRATLETQLQQEMTDRVAELFKFFGVAPGEWQELALALARQHVPGFAVSQNQGAPEVETVWLLSRLYRYINRRRAQRIRDGVLPSVSAECGHIAGKAPFVDLFPELANANKRRLANLHSKAKGMRRAYVEWRVGTLRFARPEFAGVDLPPGIVGSPPPWDHEGGTAFYRALTARMAEEDAQNTFTEGSADRSA